MIIIIPIAIALICALLYPYSQVSDAVKQEHIQRIKENH